MEKADCSGCRDNFYNGNNPFGVEECWSFKNAQLTLRRRVGIWDRPPWTNEPERLPDCYKVKGAIFVGPNQER
jgi:hypothetical protein